jgi:hypothetical protein
VEIAIFCVAIAFATGLLGANPWKASIMGFVIVFIGASITLSVERGVHDWWGLYAAAFYSLPLASAAVAIAFTVAKLRR